MRENTIPTYLMSDKYWKPVLYLFKHHPKLNACFTTKYFDLKGESIYVSKLKYASRPWSQSEKFMLNLALHLFNDNNKLPNGLSEMSYLDDSNKALAMKAISLRFG